MNVVRLPAVSGTWRILGPVNEILCGDDTGSDSSQNLFFRYFGLY